MNKGTIIHILAVWLFTILTFSCHSLYGMQALRNKQAQVTQQIKIAATSPSCTLKQIFLLDEDKQPADLTCGPRSVYLAVALEKVFLQKAEVNPKSIHNALKELDFLPQMMACVPLGTHESDQFQAYIKFAREAYAMPLPYFFSLNNDPTFGIYVGMPSSTQDPEVVLKKLKTELAKNRLSSPIHFICNIGGHWVTFSVTQRDNEITLWYIDPMNGSISALTKNIFGKYICEQLGLLPSI